MFNTCRYIDKITNAKWEVKELGLEHNGCVLLFQLYLVNFVFSDVDGS